MDSVTVFNYYTLLDGLIHANLIALATASFSDHVNILTPQGKKFTLYMFLLPGA